MLLTSLPKFEKKIYIENNSLKRKIAPSKGFVRFLAPSSSLCTPEKKGKTESSRTIWLTVSVTAAFSRRTNWLIGREKRNKPLRRRETVEGPVARLHISYAFTSLVSQPCVLTYTRVI